MLSKRPHRPALHAAFVLALLSPSLAAAAIPDRGSDNRAGGIPEETEGKTTGDEKRGEKKTGGKKAGERESGGKEIPGAGGQTAAPRERRKRPPPEASRRLAKGRERMVRDSISHPRDGRGPVKSEAVIEAMQAVPRYCFVPENLRRHAHDDSPLPIGYGQTISQPYIVAWMTELLQLEPDSRVLEIGTGSGYQAAVLAHLTPHVYTVEIIEPLATRAKKTFEELGYKEIHARNADGYFGWKDEAPFDAIIVTCAAGHLPPPLWQQLRPGGRIVIPIGGPYQVQRLVVVTKTKDGKRRSRTVADVRFVPLTRGASSGEPGSR